MIAKIVALIINEIYQEFQKLQPAPDHPDESVLSFNSALNPAQTGHDAMESMSANIGFNWAVKDGTHNNEQAHRLVSRV